MFRSNLPTMRLLAVAAMVLALDLPVGDGCQVFCVRHCLSEDGQTVAQIVGFESSKKCQHARLADTN